MAASTSSTRGRSAQSQRLGEERDDADGRVRVLKSSNMSAMLQGAGVKARAFKHNQMTRH